MKKREITEDDIIIKLKCQLDHLCKYQLRLMIRACNELLDEDDRPEYPKNFKIENKKEA